MSRLSYHTFLRNKYFPENVYRKIKISKYITVHGDTVYNYNFIQKINEQKYYNQISPTKTNYVSYNDVTTLFIENMVTIIYCTSFNNSCRINVYRFRAF